MNQKILLLIPITALLAGWLIGRLFAPDAPAPSQAEVTGTSVSSEVEEKAETLSSDASGSLSKRVDSLLKRLPNSGNFITMQVAVYEFAKTLRSEEFAAVIAQCSQQNTRGRNWIASMFAEYWMEVDSPAALAWFEQLSSEQQTEFSSSILSSWGRKQDGQMLDWAEKLPDSRLHLLTRNHSLIIGDTVRPEDFDRLLALIQRAPPFHNELNYASGSPTGVLFLTLAKTAPLDAISRAMALPSGGSRNQALAGAVYGWASTDPAAAKQWAESIQDPALAAYVITACSNGMLQNDAKSAADWIATLPDTLTNQATLAGAVSMWAADDAVAALEWVDGFPDGANTKKYINGILTALAYQDPVLAIETVLSRAGSGLSLGGNENNAEYTWLQNSSSFSNYLKIKGAAETLKTATGIPDKGDPTLDSMYRNLIAAAANENFADTTEWLLKQQGAKRRGESFGRLAYQILDRDPAAARSWAENLPINADTDSARQNIANRSIQSATDAAVKIYRQMTDAHNGEALLKADVQSWLKSDPIAAESWLSKTSAFNGEQKAELRQKGASR